MTPRGTLILHHLRMQWRDPRPWGFLLALVAGLAVMATFFSQTAEPDLLGKNAMLQRMVQVVLFAGLGVSGLVAADAFSGERERGTLEALLLAPLRGTDLLLAKAAAALSWWVALVLVGLPFAWVLAFDPGSFADAALLLLGPGTLMAVLVVGLGLAVSARASENARSIGATLVALGALFGPAFVPRLHTLAYGETVLRIDPASALDRFIDIVLVQSQSWGSGLDWLVAPVLGAILMAAVAWALARRVPLDPGVDH